MMKTTLPGILGVHALTIDAGGGVLLISSDAALYRVGTDGKSARVPVSIDGQSADVWNVALDHSAATWLVAAGSDGVNKAGKLGADGALKPIDLGGKEPRQLTWGARELWFTATDTTLNRWTAEKGATAAGDARCNAVIASADGAHVAVRRTPSDAVFLTPSSGPLTWTSLRPSVSGELVSISNAGELTFLELGVWRDGPPPDSQLLRAARNGEPVLLRKGPYLRAAIRGSRLALAGRGKAGLVLEVVELR